MMRRFIVLALAFCLLNMNHHVHAQKKSNLMFCIGKNDHGQCTGTAEEINTTLNGINFPPASYPIVKSCAAWDHTVVLVGNEAGTATEIFTWGKSDRGQIGRDGDVKAERKADSVVQFNYIDTASSQNDQMVYVEAGEDFTLGLSDDKRVWGWGETENQRQGNSAPTEDPPSIDLPTQIQVGPGSTFEDIVSISAGSRHGLACTASGDIYVWGANDEYQSLDSTQNTPVFSPSAVTINNFECASVSASEYSSFVMNADGTEVYTWGFAGTGALALDEEGVVNTALHITTPQAVPLPPGVTKWKSLHAGDERTIALTDEGFVYVAGRNSGGGLGLPGSTVKATQWTRLVNGAITDSTSIERIWLGPSYTLAATKDLGRVIIWGASPYAVGASNGLYLEPTELDLSFLTTVHEICPGKDHIIFFGSGINPLYLFGGAVGGALVLGVGIIGAALLWKPKAAVNKRREDQGAALMDGRKPVLADAPLPGPPKPAGRAPSSGGSSGKRRKSGGSKRKKGGGSGGSSGSRSGRRKSGGSSRKKKDPK